jgi:IstB-like ATP binding protein
MLHAGLDLSRREVDVCLLSTQGEILGDAMVAAALIDRLIHHAHMVTLKGKSYRLRERGTGAAPAVQAPGLRPSA